MTFHSRSARPRLALALLLLLAPAVRAETPAEPARALLQKVQATYAGLSKFDIAAQMDVNITGEKMNNRVTVPIRFSADRPRRFRNEVLNPNFPSRYISDGDSLFAWLPLIRQYISWSAADAATMAEMDPNFAQSLSPFREYERIGEHVRTARLAGPDTVQLADRTAEATRLVVEYERDTSRTDIVLGPRTFWVEGSGLVVKDSVRAQVTHAQLGQLATSQVTRIVSANLAPVFADTLFRFTPPEGATRGEAPQLPPALKLRGRPAPDFSLPRYGAVAVKGRAPAPVRLSGLKGKVVLLDFWATWCGPCRRWMPIVDKVRGELAAKGLVVYAVNEREDDAKIRDYLAKTGVKVPVLTDRDGKVGEVYQAGSIPLTVIVGRDGVIARVLVGLHDESQLREALKGAGL